MRYSMHERSRKSFHCTKRCLERNNIPSKTQKSNLAPKMHFLLLHFLRFSSLARTTIHTYLHLLTAYVWSFTLPTYLLGKRLFEYHSRLFWRTKKVVSPKRACMGMRAARDGKKEDTTAHGPLTTMKHTYLWWHHPKRYVIITFFMAVDFNVIN